MAAMRVVVRYRTASLSYLVARPRLWIAPGVVEGLNPWKDEDHARTQEVPR